MTDPGDNGGGRLLRWILGAWVVGILAYLIWASVKHGGAP